MNSSRMSPSLGNAQSPGLKTYFKTPEGRYKLQYEKTHPAGFLHFTHGKSITQVEKPFSSCNHKRYNDYWVIIVLLSDYCFSTFNSCNQKRYNDYEWLLFLHFILNEQVTLAHLKDKTTPPTPSSCNLSSSSGGRFTASRLLSGGNGSRALSFVGGSTSSKAVAGNFRTNSLGVSGLNNSSAPSNYEGKGTYLVFNVGDTIFISDFNSQDKVLNGSYYLLSYLVLDWNILETIFLILQLLLPL